ncbi:hypothetical protein pipiens_016537 [Culex pipiens pipiens]|uniref:Small ribosomal subunit protein RACK1 n=1 Tax=Culex pipiens pipiens TaxID=38569 RepID=A0ABD1CLS1_CULPP
MTETLQLHIQLVGHSGWTLIVWKLTRDDASYGIPHFISDVVLSSDGNYALRPTDSKNVLSFAFSVDNQVRSCSALGHNAYFNSVSPDGSLCTSGGMDCKAFLWDLNDGKYLHTPDHVIIALCFSPNQYWLCVAYGPSSKIWDMACKTLIEELKPLKANLPQCLSLAWFTEGQTLYAGCTVTVWQAHQSSPGEEERLGFFIQLDKAANPFSPFKKVKRGDLRLYSSRSSVDSISLRDVNLQQVVSVEPSVFDFITSSKVRA